jgi:hypothetical protein
MKIKTSLFLSLRVLLGAVFLVSGAEKLMSPYQNFSAVIEKYGILHGDSAVFLSQGLPWVELLAGVFFVLGLWERASLWTLWVLNTGLIGMVSQALLRKLPVDECGCFGEVVSLSLPQILVLDIVLWGSFFIYWFFSSRVLLPGLDRKFKSHAGR